jgi:hypothetical protein
MHKTWLLLLSYLVVMRFAFPGCHLEIVREISHGYKVREIFVMNSLLILNLTVAIIPLMPQTQISFEANTRPLIISARISKRQELFVNHMILILIWHLIWHWCLQQHLWVNIQTYSMLHFPHVLSCNFVNKLLHLEP